MPVEDTTHPAREAARAFLRNPLLVDTLFDLASRSLDAVEVALVAAHAIVAGEHRESLPLVLDVAGRCMFGWSRLMLQVVPADDEEVDECSFDRALLGVVAERVHHSRRQIFHALGEPFATAHAAASGLLFNLDPGPSPRLDADSFAWELIQAFRPHGAADDVCRELRELHARLELERADLMNRADDEAADRLAVAAGIYRSLRAMGAHERTEPPPGNRAEDLVQTSTCAALVKTTKRTLERWNESDAWPDPVIQGVGGKPTWHSWARIRPWLTKHSGLTLPEHLPDWTRR